MELQTIQSKIYEIRGHRVMLDFDLAKLYSVETKRLKEQVKRNIDRFPDDFIFQLSDTELELVANCDQFPDRLKHSHIAPMAFTQEGIAMLSGVLRSPIAIQVNIAIMRAFVAMRRVVMTAVELSEIRKELELLRYADESILESVNDLSETTREEIDTLYEAVGELSLKVLEPPKRPRRPIGYIRRDEE